MFCRKGVLRPTFSLKKETLAKVSSCEFCEIFKNTLQNTSAGCFCYGLDTTEYTEEIKVAAEGKKFPPYLLEFNFLTF